RVRRQRQEGQGRKRIFSCKRKAAIGTKKNQTIPEGTTTAAGPRAGGLTRHSTAFDCGVHEFNPPLRRSKKRGAFFQKAAAAAGLMLDCSRWGGGRDGAGIHATLLGRFRLAQPALRFLFVDA